MRLKIFRVKKPSCKILKTKNCVPFEVQYTSKLSMYAKSEVSGGGWFDFILRLLVTYQQFSVLLRWPCILAHGYWKWFSCAVSQFIVCSYFRPWMIFQLLSFLNQQPRVISRNINAGTGVSNGRSCFFLTLKAPITTVANYKFCDNFPNFWQK